MTSHDEISELIHQTHFDAARQVALSLLQKNRRDSRVWILLGQAMRGLLKGQMAIRCFRRAALFDPTAEVDNEITQCQEIQQGKVDVDVERHLFVPTKTVTAVLIVRDEIRTIKQCLASLSRAVDEIVVVDTGSLDGTDKIAQAMGARLHRFEWNDDFAAARNFALSLVTTDWVLAVDADEILHEEDVDTIRTVAGAYDDSTGGPLVIEVSVMNRFGSSMSVSWEMRMFPMNKGLHWVRPIHEQISAMDPKQRIPVFPAKIRFFHDGYDPGSVDVRAKFTRNVRILEKHLQMNPNNYMSHKFLAREYLMLENVDAAKKHLKMARDLCIGTVPPLSNIDKMLIFAAEDIGEMQLAEELALQLTQDHPDFVDAWYLYGFYQLKKASVLQTARQYLTKAAELVAHGKQGIDPSIGTHKALLHLADVNRLSGNWVEARQQYKQILREIPDFVEVKNTLERMDRQIVQMAEELKNETN